MKINFVKIKLTKSHEIHQNSLIHFYIHFKLKKKSTVNSAKLSQNFYTILYTLDQKYLNTTL